MRAHRVKCQQCANGVTIVVARHNDETDGESHLTFVYAGIQDESAVTDKAAAIVAEEETEARLAMLEEGEEPDDVITAEQIKATWTFDVSNGSVRP